MFRFVNENPDKTVKTVYAHYWREKMKKNYSEQQLNSISQSG